jgi:hypothetical protein
MRWKLPELDWKLDPVAIAALFLSLGAVGAGLAAWLRGPAIRLIPPERVALYGDTSPSGGVIVRIAAPMSYANIAQAPYGSLVVNEQATLSVGNIRSKQEWNAFGEIKRGSVQSTGVVVPQSLPGQSAVSHVTLFTPLPGPDYISPEKLFHGAAFVPDLRFQFQIAMIDGSKLMKSCSVPLNELSRTRLAKVGTEMFFAVCRPVSL